MNHGRYLSRNRNAAGAARTSAALRQSESDRNVISAQEDDMKTLIAVLAAASLAACASYGGAGLRPGESRLDDVQRVMGDAALRWQDADGSLRLAYPRGPAGFHTYMVRIGADGRLREIRNVLEPESFGGIRPGMTQDAVLRALGPSQPAWSAYFAARDERVWEWRYCDNQGEPARFDVLFDGATRTVRSTQTILESQLPLAGGGPARCAR
jgi:hypothetical protein